MPGEFTRGDGTLLLLLCDISSPQRICVFICAFFKIQKVDIIVFSYKITKYKRCGFIK